MGRFGEICKGTLISKLDCLITILPTIISNFPTPHPHPLLLASYLLHSYLKTACYVILQVQVHYGHRDWLRVDDDVTGQAVPALVYADPGFRAAASVLDEKPQGFISGR